MRQLPPFAQFEKVPMVTAPNQQHSTAASCGAYHALLNRRAALLLLSVITILLVATGVRPALAACPIALDRDDIYKTLVIEMDWPFAADRDVIDSVYVVKVLIKPDKVLKYQKQRAACTEDRCIIDNQEYACSPLILKTNRMEFRSEIPELDKCGSTGFMLTFLTQENALYTASRLGKETLEPGLFHFQEINWYKLEKDWRAQTGNPTSVGMFW